MLQGTHVAWIICDGQVDRQKTGMITLGHYAYTGNSKVLSDFVSNGEITVYLQHLRLFMAGRYFVGSL